MKSSPQRRKRNCASVIRAMIVSALGISSPAIGLNIMPLGDSLVEGLCANGITSGPSADCVNAYGEGAFDWEANWDAREQYQTYPNFCGAFAEHIVEDYNPGNAGGFRGPLLNQLTAAGISVSYKGRAKSGSYGTNNAHEGHGGWYAKHIKFCTPSFMTAQHPNTVLLEVGTNDLNGSESPITIANTIDGIRQAIIQQAPATRVLIASVPSKYALTTPPSTYTRDGTFEGRRTLAMNEVAKKSGYDFPCTGGNLPDMGVLRASEMNHGGGGGLHPNSAGYSRMASIWFSSLTTPECKFDTRTFVTLNGVMVESITAYGRYWNIYGTADDRGTLNRPGLPRYQSICDSKPVCTFDTRMFIDSPSGPRESLTAYNNIYNYTSAGALISSGPLRGVTRYNQYICALTTSPGCVFDTRALRSGGAIETITAYGHYFDFQLSNGQFIASGTLNSVARYQQICSYKPASQLHCTFDTRTYIQLPNLPYMESITAYGRYWNFNGSTGALLDSGVLASVAKYKKQP